jgi:CHAD domain-containing protein
VKAARIDLKGVENLSALVERVVRMRLQEARALAGGLESREKQALHDFEIACKRLRYALERFQELDPAFAPLAEPLARLQDALGEAHDRDVLLSILPPSMAATERRLKGDREVCVNRAVAHWGELQQLMQALDSHRI